VIKIEQAGDGPSAYPAPTIEDYGSLVELTAAFDPDLVGSVAKGLSLAVVSAAFLPGMESSSTGFSGGGSGGGDTAGASGAGGGGGEGGSGAGGRLPFTGYSVVLTAAVGAALAGAGAGAKSALRRRRA